MLDAAESGKAAGTAAGAGAATATRPAKGRDASSDFIVRQISWSMIFGVLILVWCLEFMFIVQGRRCEVKMLCEFGRTCKRYLCPAECHCPYDSISCLFQWTAYNASGSQLDVVMSTFFVIQWVTRVSWRFLAAYRHDRLIRTVLALAISSSDGPVIRVDDGKDEGMVDSMSHVPKHAGHLGRRGRSRSHHCAAD